MLPSYKRKRNWLECNSYAIVNDLPQAGALTFKYSPGCSINSLRLPQGVQLFLALMFGSFIAMISSFSDWVADLLMFIYENYHKMFKTSNNNP
jgi:hypothetical protein